LQCSDHGIALLFFKTPALRAVNHRAENAEKLLDPSVAVFEHANGIIESTIWLRTNLNRHVLSFF
jgi:hypothetical protein